MIIQSHYNRNRRMSFHGRVEYEKAMEAAAAGAEVEVLVAGRYNGPNHKALPYVEKGEIICIATGAYLASLLADGRVRLADDLLPVTEIAPPTDTSSPQETPNSPADLPGDHTFLLEAGLTERQARAVYDAGFTSALAIQQSEAAAGIDGLVSIKGIGEQTARLLIDWANRQ